MSVYPYTLIIQYTADEYNKKFSICKKINGKFIIIYIIFVDKRHFLCYNFIVQCRIVRRNRYASGQKRLFDNVVQGGRW